MRVIEDRREGAVFVFSEDGVELGEMVHEFVFADSHGELLSRVDDYATDYGSGDGRTTWCPSRLSALAAASKFANGGVPMVR